MNKQKFTFFSLISAIMLISIILVGLVSAKDTPSGDPFKTIWDSISDLQNKILDLFNITSDLQNQITNISLTPGPQGPQGMQGEPGLPGPTKELEIDYVEGAMDIINQTTADWWNDNWKKRKLVTIQGGIEKLNDFPVYILINKEDSMQLNYNDIRFIQNNNRLAYEIDWADSTGAGFWVKIPNLEIGNNELYIYYDNQDATPGENTQFVWTNGYVGVWHLTQKTGNYYEDSKGNSNAVEYGTSTSIVKGKMGNAVNFDGASNYLNLGPLNGNPPFTWEIWATRTASGSKNLMGVSSQYGSLVSYISAPTDTFRFGRFGISDVDSGFIPSFSDWHYYSTGYSLGDLSLQLDTNDYNRIFSETGTSGNIWVGYFGSGPTYYWRGKIDEIRISNIKRSYAWTTRSYNNGDPSYASLGNEESLWLIIIKACCQEGWVRTGCTGDNKGLIKPLDPQCCESTSNNQFWAICLKYAE